tara:strand:+ start:2373 stop:2834 length:462 start_codon:yes stop_codon:yes gene_type:complete
MTHLQDNDWVTLDGKPIPDITSHVRSLAGDDRYTLHVGTDSKQFTEYTIITTAICFREPGHGVIVAYQRQKINNYGSVYERLIQETLASLAVAEFISTISGISPTVHADVNIKEEALSNRVLSTIMGMVKGMGYPVVVKPDAWAADIADMFTR